MFRRYRDVMETVDLIRLTTLRHWIKSGTAMRLRKDAGLSQSQVAAVCGVSAAAVSRWEAARRTPRGEPAFRYAWLLTEIERVLKENATGAGGSMGRALGSQ